LHRADGETGLKYGSALQGMTANIIGHIDLPGVLKKIRSPRRIAKRVLPNETMPTNEQQGSQGAAANRRLKNVVLRYRTPQPADEVLRSRVNESLLPQ
jgi:hypothetical protein